MSHPTKPRVNYPTWLKTGAHSHTAHYYLCRYLTICEVRNVYTTSITHGLEPKPCPICLGRLLDLGTSQEDIDRTWANASATPKG